MILHVNYNSTFPTQDTISYHYEYLFMHAQEFCCPISPSNSTMNSANGNSDNFLVYIMIRSLRNIERVLVSVLK